MKREEIEENTGILILRTRGLDFFFERVEGFRRPIVNEFYSHMKVKNGEKKITCKVTSNDVIITPTSIALYWQYNRPQKDP